MTLSLCGIPRWISDWFKKADKNNDGRMNFKEVQDLLKMMNVDMNEHHAHRLFTVRSHSLVLKFYFFPCNLLAHLLDFEASTHGATLCCVF